MKKYKFTVFTATYNRAYLLENLYNDLKNQTYKNFEWLIVDDGSSDNTKELVKKFQDENILEIRYAYKENGGKHTAINEGIRLANGEGFFIVDSDDRLLDDSLQTINEEWNTLDLNSKISGIVGLCVDNNEEIVGTPMPSEHKVCNFTDLYFKYGVKGDKSLVFMTKVLRNYKFPEIKGINFLPESVVWHEISKDYTIQCVNKALRKVEYLEDGLTKNILSQNALKGRALEYLYLTNQNTYPIDKYPYMWIKNYINLARYSLLSNSSYFKDINKIGDKMMYMLCFPLGYYKYTKQKNIIKK